MLSMVTINVKYGDKIGEISVATRLDVLNPFIPYEDGDQRVANFHQLQALIDDFIVRGFITFVPEHNTEKEHCVTVKGVDEYMYITKETKLSITSVANDSTIAKVDCSCPNGEYLIEEVLKTACRSNVFPMPLFLKTASKKEFPISVKLSREEEAPPNSWFPSFSNYTKAAIGFAVLAVGYELTQNYFNAPKNTHG